MEIAKEIAEKIVTKERPDLEEVMQVQVRMKRGLNNWLGDTAKELGMSKNEFIVMALTEVSETTKRMVEKYEASAENRSGNPQG